MEVEDKQIEQKNLMQVLVINEVLLMTPIVQHSGVLRPKLVNFNL